MDITQQKNSRLGRSGRALMARGIDAGTAARLVAQGLTISSLKTETIDELIGLGFPPEVAKKFIRERRSPIPSGNVSRVLFSNRWTCCVCRDVQKPVIIHHIDTYADTKDHSEDNLAVLCLHHHGEAHTTRELTKTLDAAAIRASKLRWEENVRLSDTRTILSMSDLYTDTIRFDYINHFRIFEIADQKKIDPTKNRYYGRAHSLGLVQIDGSLSSPKELGLDEDLWQRYDFGDGMYLYPYVFQLVKSTLADTPIINISDLMDRGDLRDLLRPGDVICVQGAHTFKREESRKHDHHDTAYVKRELRGIRIKFQIDVWDATSNSARACFLSGRQSCMSISTIRKIEPNGLKLEITTSALVVGAGFQNLQSRNYSPHFGRYSSWDSEEDRSENDPW